MSYRKNRLIRLSIYKKVKAPKLLLELALNAGMGLYNVMGFGCVEGEI